ncbi:MAG: hypothetical protein JWN94_310 [Betaproteobacteria bacterium]|nr:hypothetical protein [Betaproteobacteria bacterium]
MLRALPLKCAVITPVGPGHELYALDAAESVKEASDATRGPFAEVVHIPVDDCLGNLGAASARNRGVELAGRCGAEWVFFLDADDVLSRDAFRNVAGALEKHDAIWGAIYDLAADEEGGLPRSSQLRTMTRMEELLSNDPFNTLQIGHFVKTAVAQATPFDRNLGAASEFDYYLRLWSKYRCIKIENPFFYSRAGDRSVDPRASSKSERRAAIERLIAVKCEEVDFHAEFTYRGEDFRFFVRNPFDLIHRRFLTHGFFELRELEYIERWVGTGAAIVEVGAYVGNHVVYYARFMRPRSILVLEPNPGAITSLRHNLSENAVSNADLGQLGIGIAATAGAYELACEANTNLGATRLVRAAHGTIKCVPLDKLISAKVDFMKIDVEGMELEVLAGAERVIAQSRPKIMIEVFRSQMPWFNAWLETHQYSVKHQFDYVHAVNYLIEPMHG